MFCFPILNHPASKLLPSLSHPNWFIIRPNQFILGQMIVRFLGIECSTHRFTFALLFLEPSPIPMKPHGLLDASRCPNGPNWMKTWRLEWGRPTRLSARTPRQATAPKAPSLSSATAERRSSWSSVVIGEAYAPGAPAGNELWQK